MRIVRSFPLFFLLVVLLFHAGCGRHQGSDEAEHNHPRLVRAREKIDAQDPEGALVFIENVIRRNPEMAYPHLMAGNVYQSMQNRVSAIHHYQRYLALREDSDLAAEVEAMIHSETLRLLDSHPSILATRPPDVIRLQEEVEALTRRLDQARDQVARQSLELEQYRGNAGDRATIPTESSRLRALEARVEELRRENERLRAEGRVASRAEEGEGDAPAAAASERRTHVVRRNETLSGISQKMYNTPNRWRDIYEANRDVLSAPERLSPGQTLVIP